MVLLLALVGLLAADDAGIRISVPRPWMLEGERSRCPRLQPSDVIASLGRPDRICGGGWLDRWGYSRLGVWVEWERPAVLFSLSYALGRERTDALIAASPSALRPLVRLATATFTPRASLLEVGWSGWGMRAVFNLDKANPQPALLD